jgi:hypothetical protein
VRLRLSPTPVRSRGEIAEILSGAAGRTGIPSQHPHRGRRASSRSHGDLRILPLDSLGLPASRNEVAVLAVESLGDVADDGQGICRPASPAPSCRGSRCPGRSPTVLWLFPLTSAPSRTADGLFLDDHLAAEVGEKGRLTRILDAAEERPASVIWVVDPPCCSPSRTHKPTATRS